MTGDKFTGVYSKYNEDDLPGQKIETYDEQYVKRLQAENKLLLEAYNAACEDYEKLQKENEELRKYIAEGAPQK